MCRGLYKEANKDVVVINDVDGDVINLCLFISVLLSLSLPPRLCFCLPLLCVYECVCVSVNVCVCVTSYL